MLNPAPVPAWHFKISHLGHGPGQILSPGRSIAISDTIWQYEDSSLYLCDRTGVVDYNISFVCVCWNSGMAVLLPYFATILLHHTPAKITSMLVLFTIFAGYYN